MIDCADDLLKEMNWVDNTTAGKSKVKQRQLAINLTETEQVIYNLLNEKTEMAIDEIADSTQMNSGTLAATLLEMEMNNLLVSLPGKRYKLV